MAKNQIIEAEVLINEEITKDIMKIVFHVGPLADTAKPGQFINFYPKSESLLLPRPISICDASKEEGTLTLIYAVVGSGTRELKHAIRGDIVKLSSPLGNGFDLNNFKELSVEDNLNFSENGRNIDVSIPHYVLVGGGVGACPLYFAAKKIVDLHFPVTVILGSRDNPILFEEFKNLGCKTYVTTENPHSDTFLGTVIDCMNINKIRGDIYLSCGPKSMLAAVEEYLKINNPDAKLQVSMEERMGCGYGACVGCVCDIRREISTGTYVTKRLKVCKDGPVFNGKEVVW